MGTRRRDEDEDEGDIWHSFGQDVIPV